MKKKKSRFTSWDEVSLALRELTEITTRISEAENKLNRDIAVIKNSYEERVYSDVAAKKDLEEQIELYTRAHSAEFTESKTKAFSWGRVGFRKSTEIITRNVKAIIEAAKRHNLEDIIVVTEKLNKDAMAGYADEVLEAIGAHRRVSDKYYMELATEKLD